MLYTNEQWTRENVEKYWNFNTLSHAPEFKPSPFPGSRCSGLRDILYDGCPVNGKSAPVFAYIGIPDGPMPEGGFPGIVLIHGGGGTAFPDYTKLWVSYGYAVIAIDWYNGRPVLKENEEESAVGREYLDGGKRQDDIVNAGNIVLAHSLLRSLPEVNPEKTGFVGLSWGSMYGTIIASLDPRFKIAVEIYCGACRKKQDSRMSSFTPLVDGRFLHEAKIPVYWIAGTNDQNIVLEQIQDAWNECPAAYNKTFVIELPHAHVGFRFPGCRRIIDHFLKDGVALPVLKETKLENKVLSARIESCGKGIYKPVICYLPEKPMTEPVWEREWYKLPAQVEGNRIFARIPDDAAQCFLSLYDEESPYDDCCGSSDLAVIMNA